MIPAHVRSFAMGLAILGLAPLASADPPARVGRISYLSGSVSFRPASVDEWSDATRNYPLTVGDHVWTDRGGRAEIELGSSFVRVAPSTEFSLLNLDDRLAQLRITQGTATVRVRALADEEVEIDTPNGAVTIQEPGFYRVDVDAAGTRTTVTARSGRAEAIASDAAYTIEARQSVVLGDGQSPYTLRSALGSDDFEDWSLARDRRVETSASVRYVSRGVIGYEDFDEYGAWRDTPGYGQAWYPRVRADWVPYRFGHWVWVDPWGWTWIDDEPWGFAPFHYGRWAHGAAGWGWFPGTQVVRPVYAPALVAFVGGSGWQASLRFGSEPVAWFPLGPREPFVPGYRVSPGYIRAVNAPHLAVDANVAIGNVRYVNRDVAGAVTAVPRDAFVRARPVGASAVAVSREVLRGTPAAQAAPGPPARDAFPRSGRSGSAPPAAAMNRTVVVRQTPPEAARARFRNASQTSGTPSRPGPAQGTRPAQTGPPAQPQGDQRPPRVAPQAPRPPERLVPQERPRPERAAPQAPPRPERAAPQAPPRPERAAPQAPKPQERVVPQERPRPERAAPENPPRPERAAPQAPKPQERGAPPPRDNQRQGRDDQPKPHEGGRGEAPKKGEK